MDHGHEKIPYPPAYNEIYPPVPPADVTHHQSMGWQQPSNEDNNGSNPAMMTPQPQPTIIVTQQPVAIARRILHDSRIGLYPMKLQPCPHCQTESKTTVKQESTIRTHILALILCAACCCCCVPLPYMTDNMTKTANHFCESCNSYIGSYKRKLCG